MTKNSSTKDLNLSSNERLFLKKKHTPFIKFPLIKNIKSKYLKYFTFNSGFKKKNDDLLAVVFSNTATLSAVYSKTSTPAAPIVWDKKNNKGYCKVLVINSGNANAHTGKIGLKGIDKYTKVIANSFHCKQSEILVSSTGVIGEKLDVNKIIKNFPIKVGVKEKDILDAAKAIMTTDTFPKTSFKKIKIDKEYIRIFGFAKGSGMIFPNMGTMLAYVFVEANISKNKLNRILKLNLDKSFNSISVDGDTSTNDTLMLFSMFDKNQKQINKIKKINKISSAIGEVMHDLSLQVVCDGEGISKLIKVNVFNAKNYKQASNIAFSVSNSPLVKTAIAGEDANWGRVIMAIGKTNEKILQDKIKLKFGNLLVATNGQMYSKINFKELNKYMKGKKIEININLGIGKFKRSVYSSDLTHEYIRINADYRS
jgi:glutamate N-acetyltransferase/amino-acid N-acetyltransferase